MASNPYKALNLERKKLGIIIDEYCKNNYRDYIFLGIKLISESSQQYRAEICVDNKKIMLDFYYVSNGTTTIKPTGNEVEIASNIAEYIKKNACISEAKVLSYSIKKFKEEHLNLLYEYLATLDEVRLIHTDTRDGSYRLLKYKSKYHDEITLKYYSNDTFQIQGKPLYLYGQISSFLSEYLPFKETLSQNQFFYSVTLKSDEIISDVRSYIPKASAIFEEDIFRKLIGTSVSYLKININFPEYSCMVMPILRGLEWYIKKILNDKNIQVANSFRQFEFDDSTKKYILNASAKKTVNYSLACDAIEECYNYYHRNRHGLFHVRLESEASRMIDTRDEAVTIIRETLDLIERTYLKIYS